LNFGLELRQRGHPSKISNGGRGGEQMWMITDVGGGVRSLA